MKIAIFGAGLTGLTIGYLLKKKGIDFKIFEREKDCGGLMRSIRQDGFTFDYGGCHVLFSKDKEALSFLLDLLGNNKTRHRRKTKILYKGRYVKYPFENGLSDLPVNENFECLFGFIQNLINKRTGKELQPGNLKEWFYYTFGREIAKKYLVPYNTKIWKYPLEKMTLGWTGRIPNPPLEDVIKSSLGIETEGYLHQLYFYYPKNGGIHTVIDELRYPLMDQIATSFEIKRVTRKKAGWFVSDGKKEELFDKIVSTIPANELVNIMRSPREVKKAASNLKYNSLICVMIGLNVEKIHDLSWLYIPNPDILPHRVSFPSNYSPHTAPAGKSSVLAEITCPPDGKIWKMGDNELAERVIDDLVRLNLMKKEDICLLAVRRTKYAYAIGDLNHDENVRRVKDFLTEEGIASIGRFGEFAYLNMDTCVRRATECVELSFWRSRARQRV